MLVVGLTGGIGSGKSTVSAMLADRGAVVIDADGIVHELQEPGTEVFDAIVERWGPEVVTEAGTLDRQAVARSVFGDDDESRANLAALNGIVHPAVGAEIAARLEAERESDHVVVLDVPLMVESGRADYAGLLVVDCAPEVAIRRLVEQRGMTEADAEARIARQASREERLEKADFVIDNSGDLAELRRQVADAWSWIEKLRADVEDAHR